MELRGSVSAGLGRRPLGGESKSLENARNNPTACRGDAVRLAGPLFSPLELF